MEPKSVLASSTILVILTLAALAPIRPVNAVIQNGPRMDQLFMKMYLDPAAEWEGLKSDEIDIMDWPMSKAQFEQWFEEWYEDPLIQPAINFEKELDLGVFAYDINTNETMDGLPGAIFSMPNVPSLTGDSAFRAAVARLVNKTAVATEDFSGLMKTLDVPLIPPIHNDFINPNVVDANYAFKYNGAQAQLDLDAAGYTQVPSVLNPYYSSLVGEYPWAVQYMRINALTGNLIQDDFDWGSGSQGLIIYSRSDMPDRAAAGRRLADVLRASGIPVNYQERDRTTCNRQVMWYFSYHFYTGGWSIGRDPDHFHDFYTAEFANPQDYNYMLFNGQGPSMEYPFTISTAYETAIDNVKYAPSRADMITATKDIQAKLWGDPSGWFADVGGMPSIILGPYYPIHTAYRSSWKGILNMQGVGVGNWWSTFLGYDSTDPGLNTVRMGLASKLEGLNPITSSQREEIIVLNSIFDTLIGLDAFRLPMDHPSGLAEEWTVGTWDDAGNTKTQVSFTLRSGLKWHPNGDITFPESPEGDGATEPANSAGHDLTVDDVAFSWLYHMAQWGWSYSSCYQIKEVQTKNGPPQWPMDALEWPGGLTATWTANGDLKDNEVRALMDITSFLSLHWLGGVYILPMFIWKHVWDAYAFDPLAYDAVIGSGPWKLISYVTDVSVTLDANRNYFSSTGSNSLGDAEAHVREMFHRRGDAGKLGGSGPDYYDGKVESYDLAYFLAFFSLQEPYTDYPMPNYWRDDKYTKLIKSPPEPPSPILPFDGTGQESADQSTWTTPALSGGGNYPWRVENPTPNPPAPLAYLYTDFNYDHYVDAFDLFIIGWYWGTDAGSGW